MKRYLKKFREVLLIVSTLSLLCFTFSICYASPLDSSKKLLEITPIEQLPVWSGITATQMMINFHIEMYENKKIDGTDENSIYRLYGEKCIEEANKYFENTNRSLEDFDEKWKKLHTSYTAFKENATYRDQALLVYICSDYLDIEYKAPSEHSNFKDNPSKMLKSDFKDNISKTFDKNQLQAATEIVLKATGKGFTCYIFDAKDSTEENINAYKMGLIYNSFRWLMPVVAIDDSSNADVIVQIKDANLIIQETDGSLAKSIDADEYLSKKTSMIFIMSNKEDFVIVPFMPNQNVEEQKPTIFEFALVNPANKDGKLSVKDDCSLKIKATKTNKTLNMIDAQGNSNRMTVYKLPENSTEDVTLSDFLFYAEFLS